MDFYLPEGNIALFVDGGVNEFGHCLVMIGMIDVLTYCYIKVGILITLRLSLPSLFNRKLSNLTTTFDGT